MIKNSSLKLSHKILLFIMVLCLVTVSADSYTVMLSHDLYNALVMLVMPVTGFILFNAVYRIKLWQKVLIGMLGGMFVGYIYGPEAEMLQDLGLVYMNLIKMVVIPLIFFSILNGITSISDAGSLGRIGSKAFFAYVFTSTFAVIIGLVFANIFQPGTGLDIDLGVGSIEHLKHTKSLRDILINIVPSNPIYAMSTSNTIQTVMFAFFTGTALILIEDKGRHVKDFIVSATHLVFKMMELIIKLTPYGVYGIMAYVVGHFGLDVIFSLGDFVFVVVAALAVQYVLFGLMLIVFAGLNPLPFYRKLITTQALALATVSSKATLSTAMRELRTKLGVSKKASSFVLPLGASINMDATSIYLGIIVVFFAQVFNVDLSWSDYAIIILTTTIGSVGAAGFPGGSMVMMGMVLSSVGLPLEGIPLIIGVDRFLEMLRTTINITGDCTITVIIDQSEGTLNKQQYYKQEDSSKDY